MKTLYYIRKATLLTAFMAIGTIVWSQQNPRSQRRSDDNRQKYESPQKIERSESANRYEAPKSRHNQNNRQEQHERYDHNNKHHKRDSYNDHSRNHHQKHRHAYHHQLPSHHYNKFFHNGCEYFHANNHFYRYHPGYGYIRVNAPFVYVNVLPRHHVMRIYNGERHFYADGYVYLPYEYGYVLVPEPVRPGVSFNIVIR
ncbi:hypothetical protein LX69_02411 [Breznakibacter xylanolyticus]|uniref:Uncharacterized protein n=1 Tax=Breznakibacter xylanolyticus TaxID=990 RepID=A0A2W7N2R1_9BACT|nr:hypothetical protein [Breznakibacter xylanolyticus]PZX14398.1 hypothetical protein LX69_02411 [Breznakibacter xylanolyticus]